MESLEGTKENSWVEEWRRCFRLLARCPKFSRGKLLHYWRHQAFDQHGSVPAKERIVIGQCNVSMWFARFSLGKQVLASYWVTMESPTSGSLTQVDFRGRSYCVAQHLCLAQYWGQLNILNTKPYLTRINRRSKVT